MGRERQHTHKLLEQIDEGLVDKDYVLNALVGWLSDDEVHQMCLANDILFDEDDEEDEEED